MTKDKRASMFNMAQRQDIEEKKQVAKAQTDSTEEEGVKIFTVRIPKPIWRKMMYLRMDTDKSLNKQINEALEQYLNL